MTSAMGKVPKNGSFFDKAKLLLTIVIGVSLFFLVIIDYFRKLGTEKEQSLLYSKSTNLTYDVTMLPLLIPFHQFLFFKKDQVEERMRCKIYDVEGDCMDIEK